MSKGHQATHALLQVDPDAADWAEGSPHLSTFDNNNPDQLVTLMSGPMRTHSSDTSASSSLARAALPASSSGANMCFRMTVTCAALGQWPLRGGVVAGAYVCRCVEAHHVASQPALGSHWIMVPHSQPGVSTGPIHR